MNEPNFASQGDDSEPAATKSGPSVLRIIEWVLIAVFGIVVANEAFSKFSYEATLASFTKLKDEADKAGNPATVGEFDDVVSGMPSRIETPSVHNKEAVRVDYRWRSLFKSYHIVISGEMNEAGKLAISNLDTNVPLDAGREAVGGRGPVAAESDAEGGAAAAGSGAGAEGPGGPAGHGHGGPAGAGGPGGLGGGPTAVIPGPMTNTPGEGSNDRPELEEEGESDTEAEGEEAGESDETTPDESDEATESSSEAEESEDDPAQ
jgi:hypothetical protein